MTQEHPITPPPELVQQWVNDFAPKGMMAIATQAAHWGADQELEACISAILSHPGFEQPELFVEVLRDTRRPKPPSLKEQALELVDRIEKAESVWAMSELDTIRRALEQLND